MSLLEAVWSSAATLKKLLDVALVVISVSLLVVALLALYKHANQNAPAKPAHHRCTACRVSFRCKSKTARRAIATFHRRPINLGALPLEVTTTDNAT